MHQLRLRARHWVDQLGETATGRKVTPMAWTLYMTMTGRPCRVERVGHGWKHSFKEGVIYAPSPGGPSLQQLDAVTHDIYLQPFTLAPGATVIDIGAGLGTEARLLSRLVGSNGTVIAIEAHPGIYDYLRHNIKANSWQNTRGLHFAVVDRVGSVLLTDDMSEHICNNIFSPGEHQQVEVPATTLDSLVSELGISTIDLLKMNIEGAEIQALQGATESLANTRQIYVSCHDFKAEWNGDDSIRTRSKVIEMLEAAGFQLTYRLNDSRPWVRDAVYGVRPECSAA